MKILVLLSRVPYPLEKGDKLRAFHQITRLAEKHEIVLCCLNDTALHPLAIKKLSPYCCEIKIIPIKKTAIVLNILKGLFSANPFQVSYFYHNRAQKVIDRLIEKHLPKHIYCQLIRVSEYVKKYTVIHKTLDYMDTLSAGMDRRIATSPFYIKPLLKSEATRLRNYESAIFSKFEHKTIISDQDRKLIRHISRDSIEVIPNGVDTAYFQPLNRVREFDLVFTGNMNYPPNIDSACLLANEIMPLIWKKFPNAKLLISGADPSWKVRQLSSEKIAVTGWVEDIRESYAKAKIFIAPMRTGTGLQNKLLEAMAMQLPCITSSLVNNALGATHGENIMIADSPELYADFVIALLSDRLLSDKIASSGYHFVLNSFNWDATVKKLDTLISSR